MDYNREHEFHRHIDQFVGMPDCQMVADTWEELEKGNLCGEPVSIAPEFKDRMQPLLKSYNRLFNNLLTDNETRQTLIEAYLENYIALMAELISDCIEEEESSEQRQILRQLDIMMKWMCCQVSREDKLILSETHPMELAVRTLKEWFTDAQDNEKNDLVKEILESKKKRYSKYIIYGMDQIYLRTDIEKWGNTKVGVPFRHSHNLTEVSSLRLIEKVEHFKEKNPGQNVIRVACLGTIGRPEAVGKYYETGSTDTEVKVELVQLEHAEGVRGLSFSIAGDCPQDLIRGSDRKVFNLLNPSDLEKLFGQYDIVLFMDEGCFYRQGQMDKSLEEKGALSHINWLLETARQETKRENKIILYQRAYETIGKWLNGWNSDFTASLQFDEKLLWSIQSAMKPEYEVYIYVSYGRQIPGQNLFYRDVCNDENYDGKEVAVYKIPFSPKDMSEEIDEFLKSSYCTETSVSLWKLIKSIGNDYYKKFLEDDKEETEYRLIRLLKNAEMVISWKELENKGTLSCKIAIDDCVYREKIINFIDELLKAGFSEGSYPCVKEYIYRLVGNAVISKAKHIDGVLVGYLLRRRFFDGKISWDGIEPKSNSGGKTGDNSRLFEPRRTALTVIGNLNKVWIRDYDKKEDYLMYEFRNKYCPGLSEEVLRKLLKAVNRVCGEMGYRDSRLYHHSRLAECEGD